MNLFFKYNNRIINQDKVWKKAMIDFSVEKNFQLVLELANKTRDVENELTEIVAIDSVKLTYGPCSLLKSVE